MKTAHGSASFTALAERLPVLLDSLLASPPRGRLHPELADVPAIYLFVEAGAPLYVGRTNTLRQRIRNHTIPGAGHNQATFAFLLAEKAGDGRKGLTRKQLERDPEFSARFSVAKDRVANMSVHFVEVRDPNEQAIFEVYAAMVLATPHNDFGNH